MSKKTCYTSLSLAVALLASTMLAAPHALAVVFTVNSTIDEPDDLTVPGVCHTAANTCTLRAAVMQANRTNGIATIMLPPGIYRLTIPPAWRGNSEVTGDLDLKAASDIAIISIIGAGADTTIIDAGKIDRVFYVHANSRVIIDGVTIRNGLTDIYRSGGPDNHAASVLTVADRGGGIINDVGLLTVSNSVISDNSSEFGGGIYNAGTLTVTDSTITRNFAIYTGGGIDNAGTLTVANSTISQNATSTDGAADISGAIKGLNGAGGGIINSGKMLVTNSTISSNRANFGGGVFQWRDSVIMVNCTISQNSAMTDGGGYYNFWGNTNIYNTTIAFNGADSDRDENGGIGGGVFNRGSGAPLPVFNLRNSLVTGNDLQRAPVYNDCHGTLGSYGRNWFGSVGEGCTITGSGQWFLHNHALGPLQNNGGPTWTHALLPGDGAIDEGDPAGCIDHNGQPLLTDQRGWVRPQGRRCDIGSYEYGAIPNTALYFPHVDTSLPWQTEIGIINTGDISVTGTLQALSNSGQLLDSKAVTLPARGRRQITVVNEFADHTNIGYIVFNTRSAGVQGYTKFYQEGRYRAAFPAVKELNTSDIYISHIDSSVLWWTGVSLVNTTSAKKDLVITFNTGQIVLFTLNPSEHKAFTIAGLFNNQPQPDIKSAVISNASGVIGLELFGSLGSGNQLDGLLLSSNTVSTLYYPHVASDNTWWTGIVAYNPSASAVAVTVTPYSTQGTALTPSTLSIPGKGKYVGLVSALGLPANTAWFRIDSPSPITGFELFATWDGQQLGAYAGDSVYGAKTSVFPKIEQNGWTGLAFVNTEASVASVILTAYNDNGSVVATQTLTVDGHAKLVNYAELIFTQNISSATYITYSSNKNVVGFQLNGSADGKMLDGLPALEYTDLSN
jgi:hypothetical protein